MRFRAAILEPCRHLELARGTRLFALVRHGLVKGRLINGNAALTTDIGGQVERKTVGVVQLESRVAIKGLAARLGQHRQRGIKNFHTVGDGLVKALFLQAQHLGHARDVTAQFRIGAAHLGAEVGHQLVEKRRLLPQFVAVAYGTAHDAAQHVAAALAARNHAVDNQEGAGANMVGDDFERIVGKVFDLRLARSGLDQVLEQVDFIVRMHVLQYRGDALQPHTGVDAGLREARHVAVGLAVKLHEHQIPDFDVPVALGIGRAGGAAGDIRAVVKKDFRAGAAGAGVGHLPEVVRCVLGALVVTNAHDALGRYAHFLGPDIVGLVILLVHGDPELVLGQAVDTGEQLPGVLDGVLLEVIAKRKITEHFEKRVMARGIADVLQVVVLAAGAHAALRAGGAGIGTRFLADEHVLELHHARVDEQQRRVVARNE